MPSKMAKKTSRKLFLFGRYSLALLLPKKWLNELNAQRGDLVDLEFDRKRGRVVIRFNHQLEKTTPQAERPTTRKTETPDGFEPIPEL